MILAAALPLACVACAVLVPLAREYAEFRRDWGLSRTGAFLAAGTILPSLVVGLAAGLPLVETPALQWSVTVVVTVAVYSLATAALRPVVATAAPRRF